jgi:polyisoprenoid-binding protein YceI
MTTQSALDALRDANGRSVPTVGVWDLDPVHLSVTFEARHMVIAKVRGGFSTASGSITVSDDVLDSFVEASIDVASLDSGDSERDAHLLSPDFLDVEKYPSITFRSTNLARNGDRYVLSGDLTVAGTVRSVDLDLEFNGATIDPWGNPRAAFSASAEIDRSDWDLTWNMALETGGFLVGRTIKILIDAEAVKRS